MKFLLIAIVLGVIAAASSAPAFAAQGQITEVNPSGIHGIITDEDTGATYHVISRAEKGRPARLTISEPGESFNFVPFHNLAVSPIQEPDFNTGAN